MGLLIPRSQVRALSPVPFLQKDLLVMKKIPLRLTEDNLKEVNSSAKRIHAKLDGIRKDVEMANQYESPYEKRHMVISEEVADKTDGFHVTVTGELVDNTIFIDVKSGFKIMEDDRGNECSSTFKDGWKNFVKYFWT